MQPDLPDAGIAVIEKAVLPASSFMQKQSKYVVGEVDRKTQMKARIASKFVLQSSPSFLGLHCTFYPPSILSPGGFVCQALLCRLIL